jgi:site-specific DNA recombinase
MAERRSRPDRHQVQLDYAFDRLLGVKLQQVYELLVPDQVRIIGERSRVMESNNADRGDLRERSRGYQVPTERVFEDEGYSSASLVRPGLERVRDLAAEGQIEAVLVYAPDRLSRKYAYQILLIEELARHGVDTVFLKAPQAATAEDQLLVQFQGMIAEYERAQILERSRRGKRHRAREGRVNVLSGAPYGYHYVRKTDDAAAQYEIVDAEADIVRTVYDRYIVAGMSIGAITRSCAASAWPPKPNSNSESWPTSTTSIVSPLSTLGPTGSPCRRDRSRSMETLY